MDRDKIGFYVYQNGDWENVGQAKFDSVMARSKKAFLMVAVDFLSGVKMTFLTIENDMVTRTYAFKKVK
jgi:hypothetical protein